MGYSKKTVFTCQYDGLDTGTTMGSIPPPGWVVVRRPDAHYFHNAAHAVGDVVNNATVPAVSYVYTDDYDGTVLEKATQRIPTDWNTLERDGIWYYFKNAANADAWLQANS